MTIIESVRLLYLQACAFRGHDESLPSNNRGNFMEMIRLRGRMNVDNQKEILHILTNKVRKNICEEVRDVRFCILVDEAKDVPNKEQITIFKRFFDI
jgi:hypothetical protein